MGDIEVESWNIGCLSNVDNIVQCNTLLNGSKRLMVFDDYHSGCSWNGGRSHYAERVPLDEFIEYLHYVNENDIPVNFTFSNLLLSEGHLNDKPGNRILAEFDNGMNGVIVSSHCLARHIRRKYPSYSLIHSITVNRKDREYYYETRELGLYDLFVPASELNRDHEFIRDFGPEQFEILVNENCHVNCPYKDGHQRAISEYNLDWENNTKENFDKISGYCVANHGPGCQIERHHLSLEEVDELRELGVRHFKISARDVVLRQQMGQYLQKYLFS